MAYRNRPHPSSECTCIPYRSTYMDNEFRIKYCNDSWTWQVAERKRGTLILLSDRALGLSDAGIQSDFEGHRLNSFEPLSRRVVYQHN